MAGSVNIAGAVERTKSLFEGLQQRLADAMPALAAELQASVLSRTPTPEEEYHSLMLGDGGAQANIPPLSGSRSADDESWALDRVRFEKAPDTFLVDLNSSPENVFVGDTFVSIGNLGLLNGGSLYAFTDHVSKKRPGGGTPVTVGPYFEAFEYGSADVSGWNETVTPFGAGYPLRPDDDPANRPSEMYKPISPRGMYSVPELQDVTRRFFDGLLGR